MERLKSNDLTSLKDYPEWLLWGAKAILSPPNQIGQKSKDVSKNNDKSKTIYPGGDAWKAWQNVCRAPTWYTFRPQRRSKGLPLEMMTHRVTHHWAQWATLINGEWNVAPPLPCRSRPENLPRGIHAAAVAISAYISPPAMPDDCWVVRGSWETFKDGFMAESFRIFDQSEHLESVEKMHDVVSVSAWSVFHLKNKTKLHQSEGDTLS